MPYSSSPSTTTTTLIITHPPSTTPSPTNPFNSPSSRHLALQTRNPAAHSAFIYAVLSTRICCRPTCAARLARRANIVFYDCYADAVHAGFRACKRCRPDLAPGEEQSRGRSGVGKAVGLIVEREGTSVGSGDGDLVVGEEGKRGAGKLGLKELAREAGLTKSHFHRVFKKVTGVTPRVYAENVRAERLLREKARKGAAMTEMNTPELVGSSALSVQEGSDGILTPGSYQNDCDFNTKKALVGVEFQDFGCDEAFESDLFYLDSELTTTNDNYAFTKQIEYTVQPWASGFVLIAATNDGICWLEGGNSVAELESSLAHEFPLAGRKVSNWPTSTELEGTQDGKYEMFETIMEALIRPTGKVLNIPFDIS